jgi:transcription elongation GreA/GreB family factor
MPQCILTTTDARSLNWLARSLSEQRDPVARQIWEKLKAATLVPAPDIETDRITLESRVTFETVEGLVHTVRIVHGPHSIAREAVLPLEHSRAIALLGAQTGDRVLAIDGKGCFEPLRVKALEPAPRLACGTGRKGRVVLIAPRLKRGFWPGMYKSGNDDPGPTAA